MFGMLLTEVPDYMRESTENEDRIWTTILWFVSEFQG
jgi:hypothetical protein